jgi:hypothetical protein
MADFTDVIRLLSISKLDGAFGADFLYVDAFQKVGEPFFPFIKLAKALHQKLKELFEELIVRFYAFNVPENALGIFWARAGHGEHHGGLPNPSGCSYKDMVSFFNFFPNEVFQMWARVIKFASGVVSDDDFWAYPIRVHFDNVFVVKIF